MVKSLFDGLKSAKYKVIAAAAAGFVILTGTAQAATVDWDPIAFAAISSFSTGGLTVTGTHNGAAADVYSEADRDVGVVGGINDFTVDRKDGEAFFQTITYSFDSGAAASIGTSGGSAVIGFDMNVEAFAPGGASLGVANITSPDVMISFLFGNQLIESLTFSNATNHRFGRGFSIQTFSWEDVSVAPVPLPAALPLFAAGLGLIGFAGWRRRRGSA